MNEKIAHRIQKLMKINLKMEHPPELFIKFATESINLDNKIAGLSDKEAIDVLIPKEEREQTSIGVMYHLLTTSDNVEQFSKMVRYIVGAGVEYWHIVLCNLNMILYEMWQHIHTGCKEQLVRLIREGIRHNVRQIENVIMNVFRCVNGTGDWHSKNRILHMLINYIRESEGWFTSVKVCPGLTASIIVVVSHMIVDTPQPFTKEDNFRQQLINFLHWTIKSRKQECVALGRDFFVVLTRLARIPQFEEIWREIHQSPTHYGFSSFDEVISRPNGLAAYRLSVELQRKVDHMVFAGGKNIMIYYDWIFRKHLRQIDAMSLRAEIVRYLCGLIIDTKHPQAVHDNRIQFLHLLISTVPQGAELQWLKYCLFAEWLGCDERFVNPLNSNVDIAIGVIRYSLSIQAPPPSVASLIQASACSPFANSLLEYICKSVDIFLPSSSEQIRKNVNTAMRFCRDRYQNGLSQIIENYKIDRKVSELMRGIWPDFMRPLPPSPVVNKMLKKDDGSKNNEAECLTRNNGFVASEGSSSSSAPITMEKRIADKKKAQKEKDDADLETLIKLLKGEISSKIVALKAQWKDMADDADKCEAVESVLMCMFKNEDKMDDSQQEIAAQCLLGIIGSVVVEDKSLLPDVINEKEISESLTHPIYSVLKMLCYPPSNEPSAGDLMTNLMAAMREKDDTITYVFLYFIKSTVTRAQDIIECYREVARVSDKNVDEMLVSDLQLCAINDNRLFAYLVPFVFDQFETEVTESTNLMRVLCDHLDAVQLRSFISEIIREEIKLFRKETFSSMVWASSEWPTSSQWVFWHLVHADTVPVEWFVPIIPKLETQKHDEVMANVLLMLKHMDREPWPGLIRSIFSRLPNKEDTFTTDALKVLIEDAEQCHRVAELMGGLVKKQLQNNEIIGIGSSRSGNAQGQQKKNAAVKVSLQQLLEHLSLFSEACVQKKQRVTENFFSKTCITEAFGAIKTNEKSSMLAKKYHHLFGVVDILEQDAREQSSRTLRGNRQSGNNDKQQKRKFGENEDDQNAKKRKTQGAIIQLDDSDSD